MGEAREETKYGRKGRMKGTVRERAKEGGQRERTRWGKRKVTESRETLRGEGAGVGVGII